MIYKNNFGELNKDSIILMVQNKRQSILIKDIVKIKFLKRQKYHLNYMTLLFSVYLLLSIKNNDLPNQIVILIIALLFLVISFLIKQFHYEFVLIKKHDFIRTEVTKNLNQDAENLANQLAKRIALLSQIVKL